MVLTFESADETLVGDHSNGSYLQVLLCDTVCNAVQGASMLYLLKAIKQYFLVVLLIMLYKVVSTYKSVDETLVCDYSNESL